MARKDGKPGRLAQIRQTYQMTKRSDPRIGLILAACFFIPTLIAIAIAVPMKWWFLIPLGVTVGLLITTIVLGRRAERAAYSQIEGQPGAAAAVLDTLGKDWFVTPAVSVTKNQDIVHRVIGRPGVILVGEGNPNRVAHALRSEKQREHRYVPDTPFHELVVADGEKGTFTLLQLTKHVKKMPKTLTPRQVTEVRRRLEALSKQPLPMPKGPIPKSQRAMRPPRQ